jgi:predicted RNase H-like nuclease (RuvC/YqgF family)
MLYEEIIGKDLAVIKGLMIQKLESGLEKNELIIGIDPGQRTGLSVFYYGQEIERSIYTSVDLLVSHVTNILAELKATKKIVKIGNGNMSLAKKITSTLNLRYCSDFELEFVDERKTSLKIKNYNQRGKRDMMSAKYITQREGYRHFILPLSRTG